MLQQEGDAERVRARDRLEVTAGQLALGINRRLEEIEDQLGRGAGLQFGPDGFEAAGDQTFLYQPQFIVANDESSPLFEAAEVNEYQRGNLEAASALYR